MDGGAVGAEDRLNAESVLNLGIYCALITIAGAKLFMFILDAGYYFHNPREIFSMNALRAGGVFYGGFVPALVFAILYMRRHGLPWLATADAFAPGIALGHAIGRVIVEYTALLPGAPKPEDIVDIAVQNTGRS